MTDGRPAWSEIRERGSMAGLRFTLGCYRLFGRAVSLPVVHLVVAYFFLTDGAGRRASLAYLRRAHAAGALERPPGTWRSFLHYRAFALSIFDRLTFWLGRGDEYGFRFEGREHLRPGPDGRGAIVVGAHLGSFDAMRLLAAKDRVAVNVLMYTRHAPRINALFRELSPDLDLRVLPVEQSPVDLAFQVRDRVARGELVAILGDRVEPGERGRTVRVELLGGEVEIPQAPFLLAQTLRCPLVLMLALRRDARTYDVIAEPLEIDAADAGLGREERVVALARRYAERLEQHLRSAPEQWFNFFDYWSDLGPAPRAARQRTDGSAARR